MAEAVRTIVLIGEFEICLCVEFVYENAGLLKNDKSIFALHQPNNF